MTKDPNKKYMPAVRALKRFHIASERESQIGVCGAQPAVHMDVAFYDTPKEGECLSVDTCLTGMPHSIRLRVREASVESDIWFSLEGGLERLKEIVQQIESIQDALLIACRKRYGQDVEVVVCDGDGQYLARWAGGEMNLQARVEEGP